LSLGLIFIIVWSLYLVAATPSTSLLVLAILLAMTSLTFTVLCELFYNLSFRNGALVNSRRNLSLTQIVMRPLFHVLVCALSLAPDGGLLQRDLFLAALTLFSIVEIGYST
jgi:hypothetical protein